jgi:hypothetical protein
MVSGHSAREVVFFVIGQLVADKFEHRAIDRAFKLNPNDVILAPANICDDRADRFDLDADFSARCQAAKSVIKPTARFGDFDNRYMSRDTAAGSIESLHRDFEPFSTASLVQYILLTIVRLLATIHFEPQ